MQTLVKWPAEITGKELYVILLADGSDFVLSDGVLINRFLIRWGDIDMYLVCRPYLSISTCITVISDFYLNHLIPKVWIFKWDFKISIIDNLLWYKDKYLICISDVGTSLCIKVIFWFSSQIFDIQSLIFVSIIWHKILIWSGIGYMAILLYYTYCS